MVTPAEVKEAGIQRRNAVFADNKANGTIMKLYDE
jgi:hypothetical protein